MFEKCYAKINLSLNITGVRDDGYHNLESIFLPIDFYDALYVEEANETTFECNKKFITYNESNTIYKAIKLLQEEYNIPNNFKIKIQKIIPSQAGLAGGSSDGAAIIRMFKKHYKLDIDKNKIKELCSKIGSDVLFTYYSRPALVSGIGEKIRFINVKDDYYVLLVKPHKGVSTKSCYEIMDLETCPHPDINKLMQALENGDDFIEYLGNSMEPAAISLTPEIQDIKNELIEKGARFALMSGSGSTVFTISKDEKHIDDIYHQFDRKKYFVRKAKVLKLK